MDEADDAAGEGFQGASKQAAHSLEQELDVVDDVAGERVHGAVHHGRARGVLLHRVLKLAERVQRALRQAALQLMHVLAARDAGVAGEGLVGLTVEGGFRV